MGEQGVALLALGALLAIPACFDGGDVGRRVEALGSRDATVPPLPPLEGDGTSESPYAIHDCAELARIGEDLRAHFRLANDVDCIGVSFRPLGSTRQPFRGSLDGDGHVITGLTIEEPDENRVGLFARAEGARIERIGLVSAHIP